MTTSRCQTCHATIFNFAGDRPHECPPAFLVWYEGHGDDPEADHDVVFASGAEHAVELWADQHDCEGDYCIIGGSDEAVRVRPRTGGPWESYTVTGEAVPRYTAHKTAPEEPSR